MQTDIADLSVRARVLDQAWYNLVLSPEPFDPDAICMDVYTIYAMAQLSAPNVLFVDSPMAALLMAELLSGGSLAAELTYSGLASERFVSVTWGMASSMGDALLRSARDAVLQGSFGALERAITLLSAMVRSRFRPLANLAALISGEGAPRERGARGTLWEAADLTTARDTAARMAEADLGVKKWQACVAMAAKACVSLGWLRQTLHHGLGFRGGVASLAMGSWNPLWLVANELAAELGSSRSADVAEPFQALARRVGPWLPLPEVALVVRPPSRLLLDGLGRPHADAGPALAYDDGWALHALEGITVSSVVTDDPQSLSWDEILAEPRADRRSIMVEQKGAEAFLDEAGLELTSEDAAGRLYRGQGNLRFQLLRVTTAYPPPWGFKEFWLRVPKQVSTATEAVAWTFGVTAEQYAPDDES